MKRIYSFDYLKFFAIVGIITIHSGMFFGFRAGGVAFFPLGVVFNTLARFAVPFFFITAGFMFNLKANEKGILTYYKKYVPKLLIMYTAWSAVYLLNNAYSNSFQGTPILEFIKTNFSITNFIYYGNKISEPLWFIPALFYSITIVALAKRFKILNIIFILAAILHITGLFGSPQNYFHFVKFPLFTRDALFFGLFYVSLGAIMSEKENYKRFLKSYSFWAILSVVFFILLILERYFLLTLCEFKFWGDFYISTIFLTFSLLMAALSKPELGKGSIITKLGKGTLGIYLIHSFFMHWINTLIYFNLGQEFFGTIWWNLFLMPLTFIVSWFFYYTIPGLFRRLILKKA